MKKQVSLLSKVFDLLKKSKSTINVNNQTTFSLTPKIFTVMKTWLDYSSKPVSWKILN